jgi:hypothetical protein
MVYTSLVSLRITLETIYHWVLTATNYFTRWVEAIPTKKETEEVMMNFLEDRIITRFGAPSKIITDNEKSFISLALVNLFFKYEIFFPTHLTTIPKGMDWHNLATRI